MVTWLTRTILLLAAITAGEPAHADEPVPAKAARRPDATWREIFDGPFTSSRLFAMPTADVVGPYQLSVSGEGSLLSETGAFSGSAVVAVGFGDIAQLEYRLAAAISTLQRSPVPLPTLGAQFKLPIAERKYLPAFAAALRLGLPRDESSLDGLTRFEEKVTDLYVVGRLRLWGPLRRITLHGGLRVGAATIIEHGVGDAPDLETAETVYLPAGGWEAQVTARSRFVGELALVPVFKPVAGASEIGVKPFGRLGIRWVVHPSFVLDASIGYRLEVAALDPSDMRGSLNALVDWDMRLGLELFVPWGAILCRAGKVFCE